MFVDAYERETKVSLSRVSLGVLVDQRAPDPPAHVGCGAGVDQRAPYEVAGRGEVAARERQELALRKRPKNAGKGSQKKARLQKANAQVGRKIGQVLGVGLEALVRIDADGARIREPEGALRLEPLVQEVVHQALAQDDFGALIEPHLHHVEDKQYAGDLAEDAELGQETRNVLVGQRIVERAVPGIEPDLHVGRGPDDDDEPAGQHQEFVALPRNPKGRSHPKEIGEQAAERRVLCAIGAIGWFGRLFRHRNRSVSPSPIVARSGEIVLADVQDPERAIVVRGRPIAILILV